MLLNSVPFESGVLGREECLGRRRRRAAALDRRRRGIIYKMAMSAGDTNAREEKQRRQQQVRLRRRRRLIWKINIVSGAARDPSFLLPICQRELSCRGRARARAAHRIVTGRKGPLRERAVRSATSK